MGYESSCSNTYSGRDADGYENNRGENTEFQASDTFSNPFGEFYSVGIDQSMGLRQKIEDVHGYDSRQIGFIGELEDFLSNEDKYQPATQKFKGYVRRRMSTPRDTENVVDEFINTGYIRALERLAAPGSDKELDFYNDLATTYGMTLPQALLFGVNGTARQAFKEYKKAEMLRGQHRSCSKPVTEQMAEMFDKAAYNTYGLPEGKNKEGNVVKIEIDEDKNKLPEGIEGKIAEVFGREKQLCQTLSYKGTKRLSGDLPYQMLEAMATELLVKKNRQNPASSDLEKIIEEANASGKDAFEELYSHAGVDNKALQYAWDDARKVLNDYALNLWKERNNFSDTTVKMVEKEFPGTIYLNGNRYYWIPKTGEKTIPLIPEKDKNKFPGSLLKNEKGGYYWLMTHLKFRRRLVEPGQKVATKDLKIAQELQRKEWEKIQKDEPDLAAKIKGMRKWGAATKHKPTAVKIAKKQWQEIQKNDPQAVSRILSDKSPEISRPDIDKVWPSWKEEKARLDMMENKAQLPVLYPKQGLRNEWEYGLCVPEKLETMVDKMKKVDWIKNNAMLVFDDNSPVPSKDITKQSNGEGWAVKQSQDNNRCVIQGCTSIDKDSGRLKFTVYNPGYGSERILAEEVYHAVFGIIREASPKTFDLIQTWHRKNIKKGSDPTLNLSEAFSQAMAEEELGHKGTLPRNVVKHVQKVFSEKNDVEADVIEKVKFG